MLAELHDRMPVIIAPESYALWLDPQVKSQQDLASLMVPYPEEKTVIRPVSNEVNNPANDSPFVIQPLE